MIMVVKVKQWTSSALTFWHTEQDKLKARWLPKILLVFPLVRVMLLAANMGICECVLGFSSTDSKEWCLIERISPVSLFWLLLEQCLNTIRAFLFLFYSPEFKGWVVGGQDTQLRCLLTGTDHSMPWDKVLKQQMLKERKKEQSWLWWCPKQVLWVLKHRFLGSGWTAAWPGEVMKKSFLFFPPPLFAVFASLIKLLSQSASLLTFLLFSPCPVGEDSEWAALWVFARSNQCSPKISRGKHKALL